MPKTMRRFLRKPNENQDNSSTDWDRLYQKALNLTGDLDPNQDPRVQLLEGGENNPERVLRRLSIVSEADLVREFNLSE